jgi:hypothetical protein
MASADGLIDAFGRIHDTTHRVLDGLTAGELTFRLDAEANSIAWLIWHLTRVQDDHVAAAMPADQLWLSGGWAQRFALPFDPAATGYGQTPDEVAEVHPETALLLGYHDAVHGRTVDYVKDLTDADLDRVIDTSWDPPVTLGTRLVSVIADGLQHVGQAAFVRGVAGRR